MRRLLALWAAAARAAAPPDGHFVLLGTQRTGTTWVISELATSPCIRTGDELMINRDSHHWHLAARKSCLGLLYAGDGSRRTCGEKFLKYIDDVTAARSPRNATLVAGFKWMQSVERDHDWLFPLWRKTGVKVVTLRRRDHVRTVLSRTSNRASRTAHPDAAGAAKLAATAVKLETRNGKLVKHLKTVEQSYHDLEKFHFKAKSFGLDARMAYYETLGDPKKGPSEFAALKRFVLGNATCASSSHKPSSRPVYRIHASFLEDEIANYDEVRKKLAHTRYAKYLDADEHAARTAAYSLAHPPPKPDRNAVDVGKWTPRASSRWDIY